MRNTRQKDLIMQAMRDLQGQHPTAYEVFHYLREDNESLSLATVYRNLNLFAEQGIIERIEFPNEPIHYDLDSPRGIYALCDDTHEVVHLPEVSVNDLLTEIEQRIEEATGVEVTNFDLLVHINCREAAAPERN